MKKSFSRLALIVLSAASCAASGSAQKISFFEGRPAFPAIGTVALSVGDFNGDGVIDAITTADFAVSVYPGTPKGLFAQPITTTLKTSCTASLIAADFNGDGKTDFACSYTGAFQVALGNGNGTFGPATATSAPGLESLSTGDFNGDGIVDLVVLSSSQIAVYLGNGNGTFAPPVITLTTNSVYTAIHPADINGDGKDDLVGTRTTTVAVLLSDGRGGFGLPNITTLDVSSVASIATADLNGDGLLDIVVTVNQSATNIPVAHAAVLLQAAGLTFNAAYYPSPQPLVHPELADVNGDGIPDLVASTSTGSPTITILPGAAGGTLGAAVSFDAAVKSYKLADPRHLPVPDITFTDGNTIQLLENNGSGVFNPGVQVGNGTAASPCVEGDFNNDGQTDLACLDSYLIDIFYATGSKAAPFSSPNSIELIGPATTVAAGDFNGDGKLDLVATLVDGTVQYLENQGGGSFLQPADRYPAGADLDTLAVGDFNNDGKLDLATGGANFLAGNGDGSFQPPVSFYSNTFVAFGVADFNGDGNLDLFGVRGGETAPVVLLGSGNGQFVPTVLTGVHASSTPAIGDLNGDGKLDVVAPADYFGVTVLLNAGNGTFTSAPSVVNDLWPPTISATLADLNGDGKLDLVFGILNYSIYAVPGNGNGTFPSIANIHGYGVEDSSSLRALNLKGTGSTKPTIAAGSSVITILEAQ